MYNFRQVLELLNKTGRIHEIIDQQFEMLASSGGSQSDLLRTIREQIVSKFEQRHPALMLFECDINGVIREVNDEFCQMSRYEMDELIGMNFSELWSNQNEENMYQDLWNHIHENKPWSEKVWCRNKAGEAFGCDFLAIPVTDSAGKPTHFWGLLFNITHEMNQIAVLKAKEKEFHDSLNYAKRIQLTILPTTSDFDRLFKDNFILFKPKDVVSGDFYWCTETPGAYWVAVVDCTGHGVPGAFMSLIGYNLLTQIITRAPSIHPGEVLTRLHEQIRTTLKQESGRSRDGMDVCLCAISKFENTFQYAGAFRPLYYWHNDQLQEIKGDKYPIGGEQIEDERIFTNHLIEDVNNGDCIYLFSDGVIDQFGGPENKKFSTRKLREFITEYHKETMKVQRAKFNLIWKDWVGDDEQLDDVTMVGIRFVDIN
jgi:PAS domain S-box-containing protein